MSQKETGKKEDSRNAFKHLNTFNSTEIQNKLDYAGNCSAVSNVRKGDI